MTASACVMASGEIAELVARRGGDDHLAGVPVVERRPGPLEAVWIPEETLVAGRAPADPVRREAELLAFPPDNRLGSFEEEHRLRGRFGVEALGQPAGFQVAPGEAVEHP